MDRQTPASQPDLPSARTARPALAGIVLPVLIVVAAVAFACLHLRGHSRHAAEVLKSARAENKLRLQTIREHIEAYFGGVYSDVLFISLDPDVKAMREDSRVHIQALFDHQWRRNRLSEVYVIKRDFDGIRRPFMTFEYGTDTHSAEEVHAPEREEEEYRVQVEHIRRFAADPTLKALLSTPVGLCLATPSGEQHQGIVYSVPVRQGSRLAGIVAAMVPSTVLETELRRGHIEGMATLVNDQGDVYCCRTDGDENHHDLHLRIQELGPEAFFSEGLGELQSENHTVLWTPVEIPSDTKWWLAYQFESAETPFAGLPHGWAGAAGMVFTGLVLALLARIAHKRQEERMDFLRERQTDAERIAEQLRFSQNLIDTIPHPVFYKDTAGLYLGCNTAYLEFLGKDREEIVGKTVYDMYPKEMADKYTEADQELFDNRGVQTFEGSDPHADGSLRSVLLNKATFAKADGSVGGLVGVILDITERKKAEDDLRESEERYRNLVESLRDDYVFFSNTVSGPLTYVSPSVKNILGYTQKEFIALRHAYLTDIPLNHEARRRRRQAIKEKKPVSTEIEVRHKDGGLRRFAVSEVLQFDAEGNVAGTEGIARDVTERHLAWEEHARLSTAIEQAAEGVMITKPEGDVLYVNPAFERISGYARDEVLRSGVDILKHEAYDETFYREMWQTVMDGEVWHGRLNLKGNEGRDCETESTISPVRDRSGDIANFVIVLRDVTHETELENRLRQAQKMEAIGALAGGIAHDFNNILYAILGYTDLAMDSVPKDGKAHADLQEIVKAGQRASDLVSQILTFSRRTEAKRRPIRLKFLVEEALKLLRGSLPATIEIHMEVSPRTNSILADPSEIHQLIMNLCTNAYHAMDEEGGLLTVGLDEARPPADHVEENTPPGPHVRLTVSDTGHGMDQATIERIFEPYFTTKDPGKGTGLGLSTVHGIVRNHQGVMTVDSEVGRGTTFQIYFPPCVPEIEAAETKPRDRRFLTGDESVLFVDDEEPITRIGQMSLEGYGYKVTACTSSTEAYALFRADPAAFDVVVTDLTMPDMTGTELSRRLLRIRPDLPIILCTGFSEAVTKEEVKAMGIREFIMKPIVAQDLAAMVRRAMSDLPEGRRNLESESTS